MAESFEGVCHSAVALACLASGDRTAAWQAYEAVRERSGVHPAVGGIYCWSALAPLACGDLTAARGWADDAVSIAKGYYLSAALMTRARVEIAQGNHEQAECDARDALGIVAGQGHTVIPDILECLAEIACLAGSHREAARLFGAAHAARLRMGTVRFKTLDANHDACVTTLRKDGRESVRDRLGPKAVHYQ